MQMDDRFDDLIKKAVSTHLPGYDWRLYKAQLYQESALDPFAISPAGAQGLAQFMAPTWREWAKRAGYEHALRVDPEASIFTGACYLAWLISEWDWPRPEIDRHCLALASYNAGLKYILEAQKLSGMSVLYADIIRELPRVPRVKWQEPTKYVPKVLRYFAVQVLG